MRVQGFRGLALAVQGDEVQRGVYHAPGVTKAPDTRYMCRC